MASSSSAGESQLRFEAGAPGDTGKKVAGDDSTMSRELGSDLMNEMSCARKSKASVCGMASMQAHAPFSDTATGMNYTCCFSLHHSETRYNEVTSDEGVIHRHA